MSRKKTSPIWVSLSDENFAKLVQQSKGYKEILTYFGFQSKGSNYRTVVARINHLGLNIDHFHTCYDVMVEKQRQKTHKLEDVMVENSTYSRGNLKKRLIKNGILENKCSLCGQLPEWKGKNLVMVLDHINGISNDNRKENLRLLCPNCNSQQPTFCGGNVKKNVVKKNKHFCKCGTPIARQSLTCKKCAPHQRKVERPSKEELEKLIQEYPMTHLGQRFGVSNTAVKKWCKSYGIAL